MKPLKFERSMTTLRSSPRRLKKDGVDFGSLEMKHYFFVEWLTTYSNLDEYAQMLHSSDRSGASLVKTSCWWSNDYYA